MKTLLLLRHAHSIEKHAGQSDKLRELSREGINGAIKIGTFVKKQSQTIEAIISSSAIRAISTATIVANGIGFESNKIIQEDELYMASLRSLLDYVHTISEDFSTVMLVGHNPHLSYLAEYLCETELDPFEPGGIVILSFHESLWRNLSKKSGRLLEFTSPAELP